MKNLFAMFDKNKDGHISYREFIATLLVMTKGSDKDKLEVLPSSNAMNY